MPVVENVLENYGIRAMLPEGWSGRLFRTPMEPPDVSPTVLHAGNFAIPLDDAGFGLDLTSHLEPGMVGFMLVEYAIDDVLRPNEGLYSPQGIRTELTLEMFSPRVLQVMRPGQVGYQDFFSLGSTRIGIIYVVLGGVDEADDALAGVNELLVSLEFATEQDGDDFRSVPREETP